MAGKGGMDAMLKRLQEEKENEALPAEQKLIVGQKRALHGEGGCRGFTLTERGTLAGIGRNRL